MVICHDLHKTTRATVSLPLVRKLAAGAWRQSRTLILTGWVHTCTLQPMLVLGFPIRPATLAQLTCKDYLVPLRLEQRISFRNHRSTYASTK
ncbi:hypothetical protein LX32DRAFT_144246 [Colletotrichum zoysiae]|uniref:Uncharacterized protein n=1 Tax=Colletotrichum zoysiae TaxID=1216348 RepID=A0AAD9H769_9PEZI|nr:hypothetical protein LX32DRAFT_144246 [Colletotrichum zoysiae]